MESFKIFLIYCLCLHTVRQITDGRKVEYINFGKTNTGNIISRIKHGSQSKEKSRWKRAMPVKAWNGATPYRWTNSHIPYEFDQESNILEGEKSQIMGAMTTWAKYTCLTFGPSKMGNRIVFTDGEGCTSDVGMVGGAQEVHLAIGCRIKHTVLHEVGHVIGLIHEHNRPDRDNYVRVNRDNIVTSQLHNFDRRPRVALASELAVPYDYNSIMHYGGRLYSKNGGVTLQALNKKYQDVMGTSTTPSFGDIKTVNRMYTCAKGCPLTDANCPGDGFVGKDCQCWCPGKPYVVCQKGTDKGQGRIQKKVKKKSSSGEEFPTKGGKQRTKRCWLSKC